MVELNHPRLGVFERCDTLYINHFHYFHRAGKVRSQKAIGHTHSFSAATPWGFESRRDLQPCRSPFIYARKVVDNITRDNQDHIHQISHD